MTKAMHPLPSPTELRSALVAVGGLYDRNDVARELGVTRQRVFNREKRAKANGWRTMPEPVAWRPGAGEHEHPLWTGHQVAAMKAQAVGRAAPPVLQDGSL